MLSIAPGNILFELICFAAFISICIGLLKSRWTKKCSILILTGSVVVAVIIQVIILLTVSDSVNLVLTLLPITAYLPAIIAVHILSKGGFSAAVATWSVGLFAPYILNLFQEFIQRLWKEDGMPLRQMQPVVLGALILGVLMVFAVLRLCRKPFQIFEFQNKYLWLIVPVILFFLLISYFESMVFELFIALITFVFVLVMFIFFIKFLNVAMSERIARVSEQEVARQLDMQKQELLRINQKMELGRIYRHDMRHHLSVLNDLAESEKAEDIQKYINSLNTCISNVEKEGYCDNSVINAVLSSYIGKARQEDIRIETNVNIPKDLLIDTFDICTLLANALDNAVIACSSQGERWISISATLHENGNFSVDVKNPCETQVEFGRDGLPVSHSGEEHGFGIKSIDAIVRKYNGLLRCTCDNGIFRLSAVLFSQNNVPPAAKHFNVKKAVSNTVCSLLLAVCFLNFCPETIQAVAAVPVIGYAIQLLDIRTYQTYFSWGASSREISYPQIEYTTKNSSGTADAPKKSGRTVETDSHSLPDAALTDKTKASDSAASATSDSETNSITLSQIPTITISEKKQSQNSTVSTKSGGEASGITLPQLPVITIQEKQTQSFVLNDSTAQTDVTKGATASESEDPASANQSPPANDNTDLSQGIDEMNGQMEEYIDNVKDEFLYYFLIRYHGYVSSDTGYNILRNDEYLLTIQFYTTVNMGSSDTYSRCFTLDKTSGKVLKLADLFKEGSDYVGVISADILRQMEEQVAADEANCFIPGGIWSDEECFKAIDEDQNFYIDENNKLIIIFDEYEVAPGCAGMPQFTVEPEILQEILRRSSVLDLSGKGME